MHVHPRIGTCFDAAAAAVTALVRRRAVPGPLHIGPVRSETARGLHRVEAQVDGEPLWFESPDQPLSPLIEAIGSAVLFWAARRHRKITFGAIPEDVWLRNVAGALRLATRWWGYSATCLPPPEPGTPTAPACPRPERGTALCFSGGVDSFHTLLRGDQRSNVLVLVQGYDIRLGDRDRAAAAEASVRQVAAALGIRAVVLRTNLREHRAGRGANWEETHGGGLAAAGHLLSDQVDRLLISASYPRVFDRPWGSHWALDPCWSSSRLAVVHAGAEKWRAEKLSALLEEPLVRRHLRVCWENGAPGGNCGRCEKCLRTMLVLETHGRLADFPVFPSSRTLAANLARIPRLRSDLIGIYAGFLHRGLTGPVRDAVTALIERSAADASENGESPLREEADP
jgi:hypothetical protein